MGFTIRMCVLGGLLVVALGALGWEYGVAVPAFNDAQDKLTKLSDENIKRDSKDPITLADVKEVISKTPETKIVPPPKKTDDQSMRAMMFLRHDKYSYYHAMPWKNPETITVVYKRRLQSEDELEEDAAEFEDKEWIFSTVHFNTEPTASQRHVPPDLKNPGDVPAAAGGGGGGRQRPDPAAIMKQNDKDGDGKLSGDEITGRMKQFSERVDTDKDGAITLEELKSAFDRPRGGGDGKGGKKGGGGKGGGGKGGGGKGARPSFDDEKKSDDKKTADKKPAEKKSAEKKSTDKAESKTKADEH